MKNIMSKMFVLFYSFILSSITHISEACDPKESGCFVVAAKQDFMNEIDDKDNGQNENSNHDKIYMILTFNILIALFCLICISLKCYYSCYYWKNCCKRRQPIQQDITIYDYDIWNSIFFFVCLYQLFNLIQITFIFVRNLIFISFWWKKEDKVLY